jgi:hypothetical protein
VSSGPNKFQAGRAFTKNRNLHAVCSTGLYAGGDLALHKKFLKKSFRFFEAFFCHAHGLRFIYRIGD